MNSIAFIELEYFFVDLEEGDTLFRAIPFIIHKKNRYAYSRDRHDSPL